MGKLYAVKSYYDADLGRLVTLEDDVLSIVSQVTELYGGRVEVQLDPLTGWYHFVGHEGPTQYLIFSTDELDGRALERLQKADVQSRGYVDSYDEAEREQDELDKQKDEMTWERLSEPVERLVMAMKAEGVDDRMPLVLPVAHTGRRRRADT